MKELDLTQGSVPKVLLHFAVPFLLANVLQALYGGADLFVVGQYDDAASVAAVAIGSQVMQTVTGVILGLTTGTTVLIAIATGAKDYRKTASIIGTSIGLFAAVGAVLTFLMVAFHSRTVQLMHTPPEALADTEAYLWICALNIVLDFILVGGCHLRAAGAAIATVASQGVSFATALWYLYRKGFHFEFTRRDIRLDGQLCRRVLLLGAPIALQDLLVNFSFLLITVIVNGMGVVASAALGVVEKLIVFAMLPPMAISSAVAAMTAQNYGAGLRVRMNRCLYAGIGMALVFGVSVCLYSQFLPDTLTGIFTRDSEVVQMASGYLRGYSIDCIMVSFVFCINAYFSGQGNSVFPMVHSVISTFLFRIPLSYSFSLVSSSSLFLMGFAPPLSTLVSLMICIGYMRYKRKKEIIPVYA